MKTTDGDFTKSVTFTPGFDRRNPDPSKNYGIGSMKIAFLLEKGGNGVQFVLSTGMMPKHIQDRHQETPGNLITGPSGWMGFDLGYHSKTAIYPDQAPMPGCHITGGDCYYDGSTLQAEDLAGQFVVGGEDVVWQALEDRFRSLFGEAPDETK